MSEQVFRNARVVLADEVVEGSVVINDGIITAIDAGPALAGEDFDGDFLIPGLVELHTDHLETHYRPRPGVFWDPVSALHAHDVQIAGSGITTVFDAIRIGSDVDMPEMRQHAGQLVAAVRDAQAKGWMRADHLIHLRCELPSADVIEHFESFVDHPTTRLISLMDHTPGQRQFTSLETYKLFYKRQLGVTEDEVERYLAAALAQHEQFSGPNRRYLVQRARALNLSMASHDDATLAHVEEGVADGVAISEFPTTLEAASAAHDAGLAILMGAPNVVRGRSHSGNISATDLVKAGLLDILSSDYVPFALLQAAFVLPQRVDGLALPQALATVTRNPANAAGLDDRGEIAIGKRADMVRVQVMDDRPIVRSVWREGIRVS
ncbi:alpha-D-ribose 1-methylphosphonate 5-triphosphate diphosphatase [Devosia psychrophila]|jgi:alpha-D-ribose 1-methylphosphonate 5-triphosphate diphosphatase|uniref:Alpha-D-ribose 1-methylphosphonate 5-triphosphate diphosphatase n=1 Tax=Devosia psychrophila TaxID=728005 RepID=A0A0F5PVC3_9HYPH|nr:alpha-D-ribose 1-methylphosphonate 5-triphosphate diphosphatase [Devosia psychrophila]KKC31779.1 phosphonate metabolism protein PhnM [Devosia psychrophila]SFC79707.1 alpha-D-ribose 1-methylphosphonate 5-triphosphate diphosphatase [Devosia psychrophila]